MALTDGELVIMATADIYDEGAWKTLLIYRAGDGVAIERIHRGTGKRETFALSPEELAGLAPAVELLRSTLSSAHAPNADGSTRSRPAYKASPAPDNLRSSPRQGGLV